ncbi:hypothetical protein KEM55_009306, partial [Ascosphaera atra]
MRGGKLCREAPLANETETEEGLEGHQTHPTQTQIMLAGLEPLIQKEEPLAAESDDEDAVLEMAVVKVDRVANTQPEPVLSDDDERAQGLNASVRRRPSPARVDGSTAHKRQWGPPEKLTELEDMIAVLDRCTVVNRIRAVEAARIHAAFQEKVAEKDTRRLEAMLD